MTARVVARCSAAGGALALALMGGPAWAVDLPGLPPAPAAPAGPLPSLLPSPVASALGPVLSQLPGSKPSAKPAPRPAPKPAPAPPSGQQVALSQTRIAAIPLSVRAAAGTAALQALPGVVAPMAVQPEAVVPQLAPVATTTGATSPASTPRDNGLPAIVVALAIGAVSAAAAGQVAEMAERRRA
jgi:hypothetical protein